MAIEFENNTTFRGSVNLLLNQLLNAVLQGSSSEPTGTIDGVSAPQSGQIFYNTATAKFGYYNGSAWIYPAEGDMLKSVYDTNSNGNVDTADNSLLLQGQSLAYVLSLANATGTLPIGSLPSHATNHKSGGSDAIKLNELALPTGTVNLNNQIITGLGTATQDTEAVNLALLKQYINGGRWKDAPARVVATSNITLSGLQTIDGITLVSNDRVLVTGQSTASQNGIYSASSSTWARTTDADNWDELVSAVVVIEQGTTYHDTQWMCTVDRGGTLGSTTVAWLNLPNVNDIIAGDGLGKTGNTLAVNVDNQSLQIVSDALAIKLLTTSGLTKTASGIGVSTDGLTTTINGSNQVAAKLNTAGGLTADANGIAVAVSYGIEMNGNSIKIGDVYRTKSIRFQFTGDGTTTYWDVTGLTVGGLETTGNGGARHITVMKRSGTIPNYIWTQVIPEIQMRQSTSGASVAYRIQFAKAPAAGTVYEVIAERSWA